MARVLVLGVTVGLVACEPERDAREDGNGTPATPPPQAVTDPAEPGEGERAAIDQERAAVTGTDGAERPDGDDPEPTATAEAHPSEADAALVARGDYIVNVLGACGDCHTPRDDRGRVIEARHLAGNPCLLAHRRR